MVNAGYMGPQIGKRILYVLNVQGRLVQPPLLPLTPGNRKGCPTGDYSWEYRNLLLETNDGITTLTNQPSSGAERSQQ